jgi:hypothetical protein
MEPLDIADVLSDTYLQTPKEPVISAWPSSIYAKSPTHSPNSADTRVSRFLGSGRMTGKQDRTVRLDVGSWFGGTEATDHEAEAALPSQSQESQDRLAPSRS